MAELEDGYGRPDDACGPDAEHPSRRVAVHVLAGSREELYLPGISAPRIQQRRPTRRHRHDATCRRPSPAGARSTKRSSSGNARKGGWDVQKMSTIMWRTSRCNVAKRTSGIDRAVHHQRLARQGAHHPTRHEGRPHDLDGPDVERHTPLRRCANGRWPPDARATGRGEPGFRHSRTPASSTAKRITGMTIFATTTPRPTLQRRRPPTPCWTRDSAEIYRLLVIEHGLDTRPLRPMGRRRAPLTRPSTSGSVRGWRPAVASSLAARQRRSACRIATSPSASTTEASKPASTSQQS